MIYFLRRTNGDIKTGTTINYQIRVTELIKQHGELELLGLMDGGRELERELHIQFAEYRIGRSEFFKPNDSLSELIAERATQRLPLPKPRSRRIMASRIAVTPDTHYMLRDFTKGLWTTYDESIGFLLRLVRKPDETPFEAGKRLRPQFNSAFDRAVEDSADNK